MIAAVFRLKERVIDYFQIKKLSLLSCTGKATFPPGNYHVRYQKTAATGVI